VRTPDPKPGWLSDDELEQIRQRLSLVYIEAVPIRVDGAGAVTEVGVLPRVNTAGSRTPARSWAVGPFSVPEYFPFPSPTPIQR